MTLTNNFIIKDEAYLEQLKALYCFCPDFVSAFATGGKGGEIYDWEQKTVVCEKCLRPHNSRAPHIQRCPDCDCWYYGKPTSLACGPGYSNCIQGYIERGLV